MSEVIQIPLRNKAKSSEIKREQILRATLEIVNREGVTALTFSKIARASGISKALVSYHFASYEQLLEELFYACALIGQKMTEEALVGMQTAEEKIGGIIEGAFQWVIQYPHFARFFLLMYHQSSVSPSFRVLHQKILDTGLQRIVEALQRRPTRSTPKKQLLSSATLLHNLLIGTLVRMVSMDDIAHHQAYQRSVSEGFRAFCKI